MVLKLRHVKNDPTNLKREWQWVIRTSCYKYPCISLDLDILQFEGRPMKRTVTSRGFAFVWNPLEWRLGSRHNYYDGANCAYLFGPIEYYHVGHGDCNACWNER